MIPDIDEPGRRRLASAALWGAVGVMTVLVAVQGYALLAEPLLSISRAAALALAVGVGTTAVVYATERRVAAWAGRRRTDGE